MLLLTLAGTGLNKRAVMMLQHIFPPKGVSVKDFEDELKESIESAGYVTSLSSIFVPGLPHVIIKSL